MTSSAPEQDLDKLISRVDFFESCIEQLRREVPTYLNKNADIDKSHKSMCKVMRGVASTEPNQKLQNVYFLYSQKQEILEKERNHFRACEKLSHDTIDEAKTMLISPLRDIIADHKTLRKKTAGKSTDELNDTQFIQSTLPLHMKMFEKHRVQNMKKLLSTLLLKEIQYHAKAVEELSLVLNSLAQIKEED